jgi:hypothetical protein
MPIWDLNSDRDWNMILNIAEYSPSYFQVE